MEKDFCVLAKEVVNYFRNNKVKVYYVNLRVLGVDENNTVLSYDYIIESEVLTEQNFFKIIDGLGTEYFLDKVSAENEIANRCFTIED